MSEMTFIFLKFDIQVAFKSFVILSSQSNFPVTNSLRSNFIPHMTGVAFSSISKTSATLPTQSLLLNSFLSVFWRNSFLQFLI